VSPSSEYTNKQAVGGRPPQYAPALSVTLTFDFLTLKMVSESRETWATCVPILVFLGLSVLELFPMYATDTRQTDVRQKHRLMPPPRGRGIIMQLITRVCVESVLTAIERLLSCAVSLSCVNNASTSLVNWVWNRSKQRLILLSVGKSSSLTAHNTRPTCTHTHTHTPVHLTYRARQ